LQRRTKSSKLSIPLSLKVEGGAIVVLLVLGVAGLGVPVLGVDGPGVPVLGVDGPGVPVLGVAGPSVLVLEVAGPSVLVLGVAGPDVTILGVVDGPGFPVLGVDGPSVLVLGLASLVVIVDFIVEGVLFWEKTLPLLFGKIMALLLLKEDLLFLLLLREVEAVSLHLSLTFLSCLQILCVASNFVPCGQLNLVFCFLWQMK